MSGSASREAGEPAGQVAARQLEGLARRITVDADVAVLCLEHLTKGAPRAGFASWAA